jgi:hypothetical protein
MAKKPKSPTKICIGVPSYGAQGPEWWAPLVRTAAHLHEFGLELVDILDEHTMRTDTNRNRIVDRFLATDAAWLYWLDADNVNPIGALRRLFDVVRNGQKTLVAGIYYGKGIPNHDPIAYRAAVDGYTNLSGWTPGEILPVDAAGMNCVLSHRSVYEDSRKGFVALRRPRGGLVLVKRENIVGDVRRDSVDENDDKVVDGVLHDRLIPLSTDVPFPYFQLTEGRTEDYAFYERAAACGHHLWVDTSIECDHIVPKAVNGADYRRQQEGE